MTIRNKTINASSLFEGDKVINNAVKACKSLGVDCEVVDITSSEWINNVKQS